MSLIQYVNAFRTFGADVLLLALGVTLLTSLFKKTVLKNCSKKLFVFLPFVLGFIVYTVYRAIATWSAAPFTTELYRSLEGGFACGCAATLYYVVYEQFFRGNTQTTVLTPLLEGFVPPEDMAEAENKLLTESTGLEGDELFAFVRETLARYALPETSEEELAALCRTVTEYLTKLR